MSYEFFPCGVLPRSFALLWMTNWMISFVEQSLEKAFLLLTEGVGIFGFVTAHEVFVTELVVDHFVDGAPVGQATEVAVVYPQVGLELA